MSAALIGGNSPLASRGNNPTVTSFLRGDNPPVPKPAEILIERIDERLQKMGKTRYWLSKEITEGKTTTTIRDIDRRGSMPAADRLNRIADALQTSTEYLLGKTGNPDPVRSEVGIGNDAIDFDGAETSAEPIPLMGTGDCADLGVIGQDGQHVEIERSSFDPDFHVRYIRRPPLLAGRRGVYAIYFHGSSMEPRFYAGEVGLVDPNRPPGPGEYALVQLNTGDSDEVVSVLVKKLVRRTAKELVLEQYNPALTFTLPIAQVQRVHRIMPQTELLFG